ILTTLSSKPKGGPWLALRVSRRRHGGTAKKQRWPPVSEQGGGTHAPGCWACVTWTSSRRQPSTPTLASFWKRKRKRQLTPARALMFRTTSSICGYEALLPCQDGSPLVVLV